MKVLWDDSNDMNTMTKTYKTYDNAVKAASKLLGEAPIRVVIAATPGGRFFPVACGYDAIDRGCHHVMATVG